MRQGSWLARNDHSLAATTQRIAGAAPGQRPGLQAPPVRGGAFGASTAHAAHQFAVGRRGLLLPVHREHIRSGL